MTLADVFHEGPIVLIADAEQYDRRVGDSYSGGAPTRDHRHDVTALLATRSRTIASRGKPMYGPHRWGAEPDPYDDVLEDDALWEEEDLDELADAELLEEDEEPDDNLPDDEEW